ncbi:MAG: DUF885 domain-containing protein [Actinomycetota bacterium]|nr:DUF885 domain-containing protein [Actinomycetota bacterium]
MSFSMRLADLRDNVDGMQEPQRLHTLFEECWAHEMEEFPELATATGWSGHNHRWTDLSDSAVGRRNLELQEILDALQTFDAPRLDDSDRLSLDLFRRNHEVRRAAARFRPERLPISKMTGPHLALPRIFSLMPRRGVGDLEDVVARLHGVTTYVDQVIAWLDEGQAEGVTPCRVTVDDVPDQLEVLAAASPEGTPLLGAFASRPETVDASDFEELRAEAAAAFAEVAVPAFRRLQRHLRETYLPACRDTVSWAALPDGEAWYAHLVAAFTTTSLTPAEIHEIGLAECERIRGEMDEVIAATGHRGSFEAFTEQLRTDPRFYFNGPEALLAAYRDIAKRVDPGLPALFGTLPRLPYGVCAVPAHEAPSTTTAYYVRGSMAAGRPGWFYANTYDLASRPKWEMEALTLHEAVPGHHLQIALAAELEGLPRFRTMNYGYTAYVEGWGLYAESLGTELGFYTDPYSRFGQRTYEMWRAVRLVVDTGIHAFGWSRQQAIDFFRERSSKPLHDITVEVDRYISWPAQALAYKLGERTITGLRREAAAALGPRFDARTFHDVVLGAGALPLDVLETRVRAWVESFDG